MKKQIWKFQIKIGNTQVFMPNGAEVLSAQLQVDYIQLWALVDPLKTIEPKYFEVFGTGHDIYCDMGISRKFISTVQMNNGALVYHVFERVD